MMISMIALRCPVTCKTCHLRDPAARCNSEFLKLSFSPAYMPGQMNTVLAGVKRENDHRFVVEALSDSPWVLQVGFFLSVEKLSHTFVIRLLLKLSIVLYFILSYITYIFLYSTS